MADSTLIIFLVLNFAKIVSQCITPFGKDGDCKLIGNCQHVLDYIKKTPKPLSNEAREYLRKLQCGFEDSNVWICCDRVGATEHDDGDWTGLLLHRNVKLLPESCGLSAVAINNKIANGNFTSLFEYPWMALLSYRTDRGLQFKCAGSLITHQYVLTAAHCITNSLAGVRLGEFDINQKLDCEQFPDGERICAPPVQDFRITEQKVFSSMFIRDRDIALLRLHRRVTFNDGIRPICLPLDHSVRNIPSSKLIVTGWGRTEKGQSSNIPLWADVPKVPLNDCQRTYRTYNFNVTSKQVCAGDYRDSCSGDSGGPLQVVRNLYSDVRFVQYGIVSYGARYCGTPGVPGVYTYVTRYLKWILDTMRP